MPKIGAGAPVEITGRLEESLGPALYWYRRAHGVAEDTGGRPPEAVNLLASPKLSGIDLGALAGAVDYGPFILVPGFYREEVHPDSGVLRFDIGMEPEHDDKQLLVVMVGGERHKKASAGYTLKRRGGTIPPLSSCRCQGMSGNMAAWFVYDLALAGGRRGALQFEVPPEVSVHQLQAGSLAR